jgi:hypothetical protein
MGQGALPSLYSTASPRKGSTIPSSPIRLLGCSEEKSIAWSSSLSLIIFASVFVFVSKVSDVLRDTGILKARMDPVSGEIDKACRIIASRDCMVSDLLTSMIGGGAGDMWNLKRVTV